MAVGEQQPHVVHVSGCSSIAEDMASIMEADRAAKMKGNTSTTSTAAVQFHPQCLEEMSLYLDQ